VITMTDSNLLTKEQNEAISEISKNLQIIACAGSGKTEVITRRIANVLQNDPSVKAENIVAFTFTEKAAGSMKTRITRLLEDNTNIDINDMYVGTIHSFCNYVLVNSSDKYKGFKILDSVKTHLFVKRYASECGLNLLDLDATPRNIKLFLECIEKMIDDFENRDSWTPLHNQLLDRYKRVLFSHKYIDFSLLILETLFQIKENKRTQDFLSRIKYLIVDEYQDVNDIQEQLILSIAGLGANICVVGDDDQTIYQFRGSNSDNMISFDQRYSNVHRVRLEKNFRCSESIVDIADHVISNNSNRIEKKMVSASSYHSSQTMATRYDSIQKQYEAIADNIKTLYDSGIPYQQIAILVRKGKRIASIISELEKRGIPYRANSSDSYFNGDYFNCFVSILEALLDVDKSKLFDSWQHYIDSSLFSSGFKYIRSCSRPGCRGSLCEIVKEFAERIGFLDNGYDDYDNRKYSLESFLMILDDYDEIYGDWQLSARANGILKFLRYQAADEYKYHSFREDSDEVDAVNIMTVHKAKGLEFHTVFITDLTQKEFPVSNIGGIKYWQILGGVFEEKHTKYENSVEDERKLFYVAVTRAKVNLFMSYSLHSQPISCFVAEAAESNYLSIDQSDLTYCPTKKRKHNSHLGSYYDSDDSCESEKERIDWDLVSLARRKLYDYYGTACHHNPAARIELDQISSLEPEEIISLAYQSGLI